MRVRVASSEGRWFSGPGYWSEEIRVGPLAIRFLVPVRLLLEPAAREGARSRFTIVAM
jgi:hypothetical protein